MKVDEGLVSFSKLPRISIQSIPSTTICDGPPSPTGRYGMHTTFCDCPLTETLDFVNLLTFSGVA